MRAREHRAQGAVTIGSRGGSVEQDRPDGRAARLRLAAGLERDVEWSDDGAQLGGVDRRDEAMPAGPSPGLAVGGEDHGAAFDVRPPPSARHRLLQAIERAEPEL